MLIGLKDNWINSGFDGVPLSFPTNLQEDWFIEWTSAKSMPGTFREECVKTAKMMGDLAEQPIKILLSGGKDSEAACRAFMEAGVPFEAAILRQERDSNLYDIAWGIIFCETNDVPYKLHDVYVSQYYTDDAIDKEYREWDRTTNYSCWMWHVDQVPGLTVGCNGCIYEHIYKLNPDAKFEYFSADNESVIGDYVFPGRLVETTGDIKIKSKWWYGTTEQMGFCWDSYYVHKGIEGVGSFHEWRPEQMLSQFLDPLTQRILNNEFEGVYFGNQMKNEFFQSHWPEMISRPKYTGNEGLFQFPEYKAFRKRHKDDILQESDIKQRRLMVDDLVYTLMKDINENN